MDANFIVLPHEVEVQKIVKLAPLVTDSQHLVSPEVGFKIVLADGSTIKWLTEPSAPTVYVGDFFCRDAVLHTQAIVPAKEFGLLFKEK